MSRRKLGLLCELEWRIAGGNRTKQKLKSDCLFWRISLPAKTAREVSGTGEWAREAQQYRSNEKLKDTEIASVNTLRSDEPRVSVE